MSKDETDEWLEELKSQHQAQLRNITRRKEELETSLKKIDELIAMRGSSSDIRDLEETNFKVRAENDQLRAELGELKLLMDQDFKH